MSQSKSKRRHSPDRNRRFPWPIVMVLGGFALVVAVVAGSLFFKPGQEEDISGAGTPTLTIAEIKSSPEAQIDGMKVDFGDMKLGAELASVTLTLANRGDKTLNFTKAPNSSLRTDADRRRRSSVR